MSNKNPRWEGVHNLNYLDECQTVEVDSETFERRHKDFPQLWDIPFDMPVTLLEGYETGTKIAGESADFIGIPVKDSKGDVTSYNYKSYGEFGEDAKCLAKTFEALELVPGKDIFGIFSVNNYPYDVSIIAGYYRNLANCSLYDTLGEQAVEFVLNETEMKVLIVENVKKLELIYRANPVHIKTVILMNDNDREKIPLREGVRIIKWGEALDTSGSTLNVVRPSPEDIATINYTSGTTGNPKGVMLSHKALSITALGTRDYLLCGKKLTPEDVWFSYLPLAHIFERAAHILFMISGARWAYTGGDMTKVLPELAIVKPTVFGAVPRTLNKLYDKITKKFAAPGCVNLVKSKFVRYSMAKKRALLNEGIVTKDTFWDKKFLSVAQELLGGRVHTIACGAAPLNATIKGFIRELFSVYFIEGYGQTENCGVGCGTAFANYCQEDQCVGVPMPYTGVKLVDVPDMNYFAHKGEGEICFKGHNMMKGYYKNPEKTAEAIDADGWLHTGDIGIWTKNGQLKITDRKKHIFKLAQGEYVAPERLEGVYCKHPLIDQLFIYGNSLQSTLVAVVVPNITEFEKIGKDKDKLMKDVNDFGKSEKLKGFEMIRGVVIENEPFTVENNLLTPTQKAKRPVIQEKYRSSLEALYSTI